MDISNNNLIIDNDNVNNNEKKENDNKKKKIKIYDVIEHDKVTYHCYKGKMYNNKKDLCGFMTKDEILIFEKNKIDRKKKIKELNDKYNSLINNLDA